MRSRMLGILKDLFARPKQKMQPCAPAGERIYAIGDIHGRLDLFERLVAQIERDDHTRGHARTTLVLLGDLIDRGPESAGVIALARKLTQNRAVEILQGNHEEMLLSSQTDVNAMLSFLRFGGLETIASYGASVESLADMSSEEVQTLMNSIIPAADFEFVAGFKKLVRIGDYVFVHAGLRPETPIDMQLGRDCRWIREPFLSHDGDFGAFVIHGHTITPEPDRRQNRIGIDTGAYMHGTLTAIGLQGTDQWFVQVQEDASEQPGTLEAMA